MKMRFGPILFAKVLLCLCICKCRGSSAPKSGGLDKYSKQEDEFIINEMLKSSCIRIFGSSTLETIRKAHDTKRLANTEGFENERSTKSIRAHVVRMKQKNLLPEELNEKFETLYEGASSSNPPSSAKYKQTDLQVSQRSDYGKRFTEAEDKFLMKELSNLLDGRILPYNTDVWTTITEKHRQKWKAGTQGFSMMRSLASLRSRFANYLVYNHPHAQVKVPRTLMEKIYQAQSNTIKEGFLDVHKYTKQEDELIMEELQKPSCKRVFGSSTLETLMKEHNKKHLANTKGFENERNTKSLRLHVIHMKKKNQFPEEIVKKFEMPYEETIPKGSNASGASRSNPASSAENHFDEALVDDMVLELQNTNWYLDFDKLQRL